MTVLGRRRAIGVGSVALLGLVFGLGLAIDDPLEPGALLYAVPVALLGISVGPVTAAGTGLIAGLLFWVTDIVHDGDLSGFAVSYRIGALIFLGLLTGVLASRLEQSRTDADERIRQSESRLADAQRIAHIGSWEWDVRNDRITWSDELYRIFGVDAGSFEASYGAYLSCVHPDDRELADAAVQAAFATHEPFRFRHRAIRPDGGVRILESEGAVFVEAGEVVRMAGVGHDVTERAAAEEAYSAAAAQLALGDELKRRAVELNDAVVQGLAVARYQLAAGDTELGSRTIAVTLERAKQLVADLIGAVDVEAGALRRELPADTG